MAEKEVNEQEVKNAILEAQKPAEQGDVRAQYFLGYSYQLLKDFVMAAKWYEKAAEQGYADAQIRLGRFYSLGQGVPKDEVKGFEWIKKAAEQGHSRAQFYMGNLTEDNVKSAEWYEKAAVQGDVDAQFKLGLMYYNGEGVPKDNIKAGQWFHKAGEQGHEEAKLYFGKIAANALFDDPKFQNLKIEAANKAHMEGNYAKAVELYEQIADRGNAMAQYKLGVLYELGQGVQYNSVKSDELIRKAAAQGLKEAKDWLETKEKLEKLKKAAEQGDADAQYELGRAYMQGWYFLPKDFVKANELFSKVAEHGDANVQYKLGLAYMDGNGVPRDYSKANELINKAAEQGNEQAKNYLQKQEEERKERERREAMKKRKKQIGKISAVIMQIAAIVLFLLFEFSDNDHDPISIIVIVLIIQALLFCIVLFRSRGILSGIVMVLLCLWALFPLFGGHSVFALLYGMCTMASPIVAFIFAGNAE